MNDFNIFQQKALYKAEFDHYLIDGSCFSVYPILDWNEHTIGHMMLMKIEYFGNKEFHKIFQKHIIEVVSPTTGDRRIFHGTPNEFYTIGKNNKYPFLFGAMINQFKFPKERKFAVWKNDSIYIIYPDVGVLT